METRNIAKSVHWTASTKFLTQGLSLVSITILARLLNASDFGLMALALVYMSFLDTFKDSGFLSAIIQLKKLDEKTLYSCFWVLSGISLVLFSITWFGSPYIAIFFNSIALAGILKLLGFNLLFMPFEIITRGRLSRKMHIDQIAKAEIFSGIAQFITAVLMAYKGYGVLSLVFSLLAGNITKNIILLARTRWLPGFRFSWTEVKPLFSFGMNITGSRVLWYFYSRADSFIIGKFIGVEVLGIYSLSHKFADFILLFLSSAINQVVYPVLSRLQDDREKLLNTFLKFTTYISSMVIPVLLFMTIAGYDVVYVLLGKKWEGVVFPLQILSVVAIMRALSNSFFILYNATGRPRLTFYSSVLYMIVLPASFYTGYHLVGFMGVVYAWIVVYPFLYFVNIYMASKNNGMSFKNYMVSLFPGLFTAFLMGACIYGVQHLMQTMSPNIRLPILAAIGGISYFSFYYLLYKSKMGELAGFLFPKLKPWFA